MEGSDRSKATPSKPSRTSRIRPNTHGLTASSKGSLLRSFVTNHLMDLLKVRHHLLDRPSVCGQASLVMDQSRPSLHQPSLLILHLLLKWSALITLLAANQLVAILIAPLVARLAVILLLAITPYVRAQGIASPMVEYMPKQGVYLLAVSGTVLLAGLSIVWLGVVAVLFVLARRAMLLRIQGTTGDTAGALIELLEAGVLIAACLHWKYNETDMRQLSDLWAQLLWTDLEESTFLNFFQTVFK